MFNGMQMPRLSGLQGELVKRQLPTMRKELQPVIKPMARGPRGPELGMSKFGFKI